VSSPPLIPPAHRLIGFELEGGWKVISKSTDITSDSWSSVNYTVQNENGDFAFLKAFDYTRITSEKDNPMKQLEINAISYNFECWVLNECQSHRMKRIVRVLERGHVNIDETLPFGIGRVEYLIFEWAKYRDLRTQYEYLRYVDLGWGLRCLHNVGLAIRELHTHNISHQDIKESNILIFGKTTAKLGDLGSAVARNRTGPRDDLPVSGDKRYAPPELLYHYRHPDWDIHRFGGDLYQFGSAITVLFTGVQMTTLLRQELDASMHPGVWSGTFDEVLPFLLEAFTRVIVSLREPEAIPKDLQADVIPMIQELCHPNPMERGHPHNRKGHRQRHSLEQYVSRLENLARRLERGLLPRYTHE
jgi:eukaryotic-like serine/threonine-protein kinase